MDTLGLKIGDEVVVDIEPADADAVDVPAELDAALLRNKTGRAAWDQLTASKQRGIVALVANAKRETTRIARSDEIVAGLARGEVPGPPSRAPKPVYG